MTAKSIAETLHEEGLEGEELFSAMWNWHDRTGIETRDIYAQYKTLEPSRLNAQPTPGT